MTDLELNERIESILLNADQILFTSYTTFRADILVEGDWGKELVIYLGGKAVARLHKSMPDSLILTLFIEIVKRHKRYDEELKKHKLKEFIDEE